MSLNLFTYASTVRPESIAEAWLNRWQTLITLEISASLTR